MICLVLNQRNTKLTRLTKKATQMDIHQGPVFYLFLDLAIVLIDFDTGKYGAAKHKCGHETGESSPTGQTNARHEHIPVIQEPRR